ncbi:transposable element Tcb1 transposase [Trichonephila clavipes]|uniref:Transposable element Tcb1 transposase n=1 Tax=Trichonephila clavipes TaxID=2585209 RepID=A0A8X6W5R4_TRICX|nr:transposable element Tcb1 transposase [Trichonephila clavipes]
MISNTQRDKTSSEKQNSGLKEMLSERDRRFLKRIVMPKQRKKAAKVIAELNQRLDSSVSIIAVRRHLRKQNIYGRAAILKPLDTDVNAKHRLRWCHTHKGCSIDKWKKVIWSDESFFMCFLTIGWKHVWRTSAEVYDRDCVSF